MFDWFRYQFQLARLMRQRRHLQRRHEELWQDARSQKMPTSEKDAMSRQSNEDLRLFDLKIAELQSNYYIGQSISLSVEPPSLQEPNAWVSSLRTGTGHLTLHGVAQLRSLLGTARKERSEHLRNWLSTIGTIFAALTGVIGALIGLLAFLKK
jgi:hypothetical protein